MVRFTVSFSERFTAWLESGPVLDDDGKAALMQALYLCAEECNELAKKSMVGKAKGGLEDVTAKTLLRTRKSEVSSDRRRV